MICHITVATDPTKAGNDTGTMVAQQGMVVIIGIPIKILISLYTFTDVYWPMQKGFQIKHASIYNAVILLLSVAWAVGGKQHKEKKNKGNSYSQFLFRHLSYMLYIICKIVYCTFVIVLCIALQKNICNKGSEKVQYGNIKKKKKIPFFMKITCWHPEHTQILNITIKLFVAW